MPRSSRFPASGRTMLLSAFILAFFVVVYTSFARSDATPRRQAFDRDQHVTLQIVTAPTRSVVGGMQYDEGATTIHSSHELTIPASGEAVSIQSVADGIPINVAFSGAEPGSEPASLVLHDLRFHLPLRVQTTDNTSSNWQSFFGQRTEVFTDFHRFGRSLGIDYAGENHPNTFMRLRVETSDKPMPLLDLRAVKQAG